MEDLLIRLGQQSPAEVEWAVRSARGTSRSARGPLAAAAAEADGRRVVVLVPGSEVLLTSVSLPRTNPKQFARAVPYALEESLAAEVEEQHFATGLRDAEGRTAVAVVSRERMTAWLAALQAVGLEPAALVPETLALPYEEGAWSALIEGEEALVRSGIQKGFAVEAENLALTLVRPPGESDSPQTLLLLGEESASLTLPEGWKSRRLGAGRSAGPEGGVLQGYDPGTALNLLQGPYSRRAQWDKLWQRWRWPLALAAAALVLQVGVVVQQYLTLRAESRTLSQQIEQLYRDTFPTARKVVDARVQMEQHLNRLLDHQAADTAGFLGLLEKSGSLLVAAEGFHLKGMRYRNGQLDLEIELQGLQALDNLKGRLEQQGGLQTEIRTASAKEGLVQARLTISRGAS